MALTKELTKIWPTLGDRNMFRAGVNLVLKEDSIEVVNESFTVDYAKGSNPNLIIPDLISKIQARVDRYKAEKAIYGAPAYDNAIVDIDAGVTL